MRPELDAAAGKVTVQVEPDLLLISQTSLAPTVKSAVLVAGAAKGVALAAMVIAPPPLIILIPVPAVSVALVKVLPVELPISSSPSA